MQQHAGPPGAAVAPVTQAEAPGAVTPAISMTAANSASTVAAVSDTPQAQIDECKREWRQVTTSMHEISLPSVVQGQAKTALLVVLDTAQTWAFEAGDSIEAVIIKIVRRTPLTFTNPSLGLLMRCAAPEAYPVIVKEACDQAKQKRKKQVGNPGYISEVT